MLFVVSNRWKSWHPGTRMTIVWRALWTNVTSSATLNTAGNFSWSSGGAKNDLPNDDDEYYPLDNGRRIA